MRRLILLILLAPAAALAAKPSAAAIAVAPAGVAEVDELQAAAMLALSRDANLGGLDAAARLDTRGQAARSFAARQGADKMKVGHGSFDNLDLGAAIDHFGEAAQAYASAGETAFDAYIQALLWQAASRWVNGDHDAARQELLHVFAEAPDVVLDKSLFPPDLIDEADRDRVEAEAQESSPLKITSDPPALVSVDGHARGVSPLTLKVPPGRHLVTLSSPGWSLFAQRAAGHVDAKLTALPEKEWLDEQRRALARDLESSDRAADVKAIMDRLGVDQLLVLALEDSGGSRRLLAARFASDGHVLAFVKRPVAASPALRAQAVRVAGAALAHDLPRGSGGKPVTDTGLEGGGLHLSLDQHGVAFLVGGVGVAAIIVGSIFGGVELHDRSGYSGTPQTNAGLSQFYQSVGNRNGVVSDVLDIVGVVGLGVGAAIWFWPKGSASAPASGKTDVFGFVPLPGGAALSAAGRF